MELDFQVDITELDEYLGTQIKNLRRGIPKSGVKAAEKVAFKWWELAGGGGSLHVGAPIKTGTLRASISAGVQGRHIVSGSPSTLPSSEGESASPNRSFPIPPVGMLEIICGANTDYAAAVHELVAPKGFKMARIAGRGGYIELNLRDNMGKWFKFIANAIRKDFESK